jgi:PhoPQ-activated pathogenicity-related protein
MSNHPTTSPQQNGGLLTPTQWQFAVVIYIPGKDIDSH